MLLDADLLDKEHLRRSVPLAVVCAALGIMLDSNGYGICPFHDDHKPSFNLWQATDGTERWGCFPCGFGGDHFSLVQCCRSCSFGEAVRFVGGLIGCPAPTVKPREALELDEDALRAYVSVAQRAAADPSNAGLMCVAAGLRDDTVSYAERVHVDERLRDLGWGVDANCNVVMPHYAPPAHGSELALTGAKIRSIGGDKWSFPGSKYDRLYGWWRPNLGGYDECLLVEGETDYAHAVLSDVPLYVLSVPSGAKFRDEWLHKLQSFDFDWVYLAFDSDNAGRSASTKWRERLATVSVLPITEGEDLRSCGSPVWELVQRAE